MQFSILDRVIYQVILQFHFWIFARSPFGTPGIISLHFGRHLGFLGMPLGALGLPWGAPVRRLKPPGTPFVATWVHFWGPGCPKDESRCRFGALEAPFPADFKNVLMIYRFFIGFRII